MLRVFVAGRGVHHLHPTTTTVLLCVWQPCPNKTIPLCLVGVSYLTIDTTTTVSHLGAQKQTSICILDVTFARHNQSAMTGSSVDYYPSHMQTNSRVRTSVASEHVSFLSVSHGRFVSKYFLPALPALLSWQGITPGVIHLDRCTAPLTEYDPHGFTLESPFKITIKQHSRAASTLPADGTEAPAGA